MESKPRTILLYETEDDRCPFGEYMDAIEGQKIHGIIMNRIDRVERGGFGDCEPVGEGVSELRIDFGPGYRVYFGQDGDIVIILNAGTKATQASDIATAKTYWRKYNA